MFLGQREGVRWQGPPSQSTGSQLKGTHGDYAPDNLFALSPFVIKIKAECRIHFTSGKLAKNQNIPARAQRIRPSIHVSRQRTALCRDL